MDEDSKYFEIRCNAEREHYVGGVKYEKCGALLGSTHREKQTDETHRCLACGSWNHVYKEEDEMILHFEILPKRRFDFAQPIRTGR